MKNKEGKGHKSSFLVYLTNKSQIVFSVTINNNNTLVIFLIFPLKIRSSEKWSNHTGFLLIGHYICAILYEMQR